MEINQKEKLKRFLADKVMSETVKEVLTDSFLKTRGVTEVNFLAAQRIAIDLLADGFKELNKISKSEDDKSDKILKQIGL